MWSIEFQTVWKTVPSHTVTAKIYSSLRRSTVACIIRFRPNIIKWYSLKAIFFAFSLDLTTWGISLGPKLHPGVDFLDHDLFNLKKFTSRSILSNFILSPLEVSRWVAQTQPFLTNYMKVQILVSYNNLRIG